MAKNRGSKEGAVIDIPPAMPAEQKANESIKKKIASVREIFSDFSKDRIAKILHFYDDDEDKAIDAITKDGGLEALSTWADLEKSKNKNNKNKKKRKKQKRDVPGGIVATASFDADDSSSLHSSGNVDPDVDKDINQVENGILYDAVDESSKRIPCESLVSNQAKDVSPSKTSLKDGDVSQEMMAAVGDSMPAPFCGSKPTVDVCRGSPLSNSADEQSGKKEKYRSITESYYKHPPRQSTSYSRAKSSSVSEDSSSQHTSQATATPTKRGYDKCQKDLIRQTASLQRIAAQLVQGFEESERKVKNVFSDILKMVENRQKEVEQELTKTKSEACDLLKSRQDLALDLKKRVHRTSQSSEAEWTELRSDIKQFVTERKYDDDLGKTIWFQWADLSETIKTFGEVQPVKNVYSQRSHSVQSSNTARKDNVPSNSSPTNDKDLDAAKKDETTSAVQEKVSSPEKEELPVYKGPVTENRSRIFLNSKNYGRSTNYPPYHGNHGSGFYPRGGRGRGSYNRGYNNNFIKGYNPDYNRNHLPHSARNDGSYYSGDRNMNSVNKMERNQRRGHPNYRFNHDRYRGHGGPRPRMNNFHDGEPSSSEKSAMNGFANEN